MSNENEFSGVLILDLWASPFGMRVRIALEEKGVDYEYRDEDLKNKSELLLKMNPVHKKIPVLVHNGKPVCESLVIVQYIDEVWTDDKSPLLLPSDPYERAQARFWADYIDKKIYSVGSKLYTTTKKEQGADDSKELVDCFKLIEEKALGDKPYLGGHSFGFLDIALIPFWSWLYLYQTLGGFKLEDSCPKLVAWGNRCMERESVSKSLPDPVKVYDFIVEWYGVQR